MKLLSQRDPKWADKKLGASNLTIGRFGCTTTCLSMLSDYYTFPKTPDLFAINPTNYNMDGLILWNNLKLFPFRFVRREYGRNDLGIKAALKDPKTSVMLQVNKGQHWVVAIRPTSVGNSYIVADPWDAKRVDVIKKYYDITGAAYFTI